MPSIGIGTWQWGDRLYWGYGRGSYTDDDLRAAFHAAVAGGVTFFDTAEAYGRGRSEELLGRFVRESGSTVAVATKFMPYPWRLRRESLAAALRASLRRSGLQEIQLYQVHWPLPPVRIETWAHALADVVEEGLARAVGVSNYGADQMRRAHEALARRGVPLASNQVEYSLLQRKAEHNGVVEACRELGVTLIAYSPLAQGLLTGRYAPHRPPTGVRAARYRGSALAKAHALSCVLREIGERHGGRPPSQVALNWLVAKGAVPIPGVKHPSQARDAAEALSWHLDPDDVAVLDAASEGRG